MFKGDVPLNHLMTSFNLICVVLSHSDLLRLLRWQRSGGEAQPDEEPPLLGTDSTLSTQRQHELVLKIFNDYYKICWHL